MANLRIVHDAAKNDYSRTSIARTRMARLPWLIRTWFLRPYEILPKAPENKYLWKFFLILSWNCMLCVLIRIASSRRFQYVHSTYHYCIEYRKDDLKSSPFASWSGIWLTLICSNFIYLEQVSVVPKMLEPLKFHCMYTKHVHFSSVFYGKCEFNTYSTYCRYFDQLCFIISVTEYKHGWSKCLNIHCISEAQFFERQTVRMTENSVR